MRLLSLLLLVPLACADEPARNYVFGDGRPGGDPVAGDGLGGDPGSGGDASPGDPGSGGDASPGDPATGCPPPGDVSGAEIIGTRLEGLDVQWAGPLELCNVWQESFTLEDEIARKIRVVLPRQDRPSLAAFETNQVGIEGALIERGPMHADRWRFFDCVLPSTVTQHEVTDTVSYSRLNHALQYDFGAAGKITEGLNVYRNDGDARPVVYDGTAWGDVSFSWESATGDTWAMLADCTGGPDVNDAVSVISGFSGQSSVTVIRYWRTQLAMAGSYPVYILGHEAVFDDRPWLVYDARGFWTQTYAAEHHNWFEDTLVDFTMDPRWYHYLFKPGAVGAVSGDFLARLDLRELAGWSGTPGIDATFRALDSGNESTTVYDVGTEWNEVNWRPVGDWSLLMGLQNSCADGEILTFGSAPEGYWLRFLTCPSASPPGFALDSLVPVVFQHDAHHAGNAFSDTAITDTTVGSDPGFEVDLGNATVRIWQQSPTLLGVDVRDASDNELYSNLLTTRQMARDATVAYEPPWDEELRASNGAGVSMALVRRFVGLGGGQTSIFAPVRFELTFGGVTHVADAMDLLDYTWVHHNDSDSLDANDGGLNLFWHLGWDAGLGTVDIVSAETPGGVVVLPETTLERE